MRNKFTVADVQRFQQTEVVLYASETRGGQKLTFHCHLDGVTFSVRHGRDPLYTGTDLHAAITAYDNA